MIADAPRKSHVSLTTARFAESLRFYRAFFGAEPVKRKPGYAKFDLADPPLNFVLTEVREAPPRGVLSHLGIQVSSSEVVREAAARLASAGLATRREEGVECCYAIQDKVWVQDPDGNPWEVFVVNVADTRPDIGGEFHDADETEGACCAPGASAAAPAACCTPEAGTPARSGAESCCG